jgi:hypothetical protein
MDIPSAASMAAFHLPAILMSYNGAQAVPPRQTSRAKRGRDERTWNHTCACHDTAEQDETQDETYTRRWHHE